MKTIAQHHAEFATALGLDSASPPQQRDMKMSFFGGASAMFASMKQAAAESGGNDDVGVTKVDQLREEIKAFAAGLGGAR